MRKNEVNKYVRVRYFAPSTSVEALIKVSTAPTCQSQASEVENSNSFPPIRTIPEVRCSSSTFDHWLCTFWAIWNVYSPLKMSNAALQLTSSYLTPHQACAFSLTSLKRSAVQMKSFPPLKFLGLLSSHHKTKPLTFHSNTTRILQKTVRKTVSEWACTTVPGVNSALTQFIWKWMKGPN